MKMTKQTTWGQGYCLLFASKQNNLVWLSTKERSQHVPLCGRYLAWLQLNPLEIIIQHLYSHLSK